MRTIFLVIITAVLAASAGWWLASHGTVAPETTAKKVLYYQSPMHPWVRSDKPGKCTVCGMDMVPVYEGQEGATSVPTGAVLLPQGEANIANISTVEVKREPLRRTLRVAGMIDDDESRHRIISAYVGGRIQKLFVNFEGAEVQAGQPLAKLYSPELIVAVKEYRIMSKNGPGSQARLLRYGLTPEQITAIMQRPDDDIYYDILAPVGGTVVKQSVYAGQYVDEGEKLFEIADFSTMWFQFIAYEQDLPYLRDGLPVEITTASLPGKTLKSTIKFINPSLDPETRSARVRVEVKNPTSEAGLHRQHELLHKLYAEATIDLDPQEVIAVPRGAVLWSGKKPRVYVEEKTSAFVARAVTLGRAGDDSWEVLEGLKPGERVAVNGAMLIDGQAQLNRLASPEEAAPAPIVKADGAPVEVTSPEPTETSKYLTALATLSDTLAKDDLAAYNDAAAKLPPPPPGLSVVPFKPAADLRVARTAFFALSEAASDFALKLPARPPQVVIFRCPMSQSAGEGIATNAKWIQLDHQIRNPYMGQAMLTCGAEVKR